MSTGRRGRSAQFPRVIEVLGWHPPTPGSNLGRSPQEWRQSGSCLSMDPEVFFAGPGEPGEAEALEACAVCPVREECLAFALENGVAEGIWGGTPEDELRALLGTDRSASPLCPSGRHLLIDLGLTSDGRCRACRRETWREQDAKSGSGLGHGRYIRTENPQSDRELAA